MSDSPSNIPPVDGTLLVIPDIPPTSGVCGLMVTCRRGRVHIYESTATPVCVLSLDRERTKQLHEALGRALENTGAFEESLSAEAIPTPEETAAIFAQLKKDLSNPHAQTDHTQE